MGNISAVAGLLTFPYYILNLDHSRSMTQVLVGENEALESALRRFKRQVSKAGIFSEVKRRRHFETPQEKTKRKAEARRKKRYR